MIWIPNCTESQCYCQTFLHNNSISKVLIFVVNRWINNKYRTLKTFAWLPPPRPPKEYLPVSPKTSIHNSWIKRDQLDVTCFIISLFNAQHVSDVNTSILRILRLICWVISWVVLLWFDVCWCYGVVWLGWCGIRMQAAACLHREWQKLDKEFISSSQLSSFYRNNNFRSW